MLNKDTQILVDKGEMLPLMEEFYTIQGEGFHTGTAAYFIRVGGCDVGCHWCDVKESWNADLHPPTAVEKIVSNAKSYAETIVITGGEPLTWDWFCLSPKKNKLPVASAYAIANELKVIIHNKHDFIFAEEQAEKTNKNAILFLQPEWSKKEEMTPLIVEYVMNNPKWRVSLQTHKYLNIP
jgi:organic radical activating enzyme